MYAIALYILADKERFPMIKNAGTMIHILLIAAMVICGAGVFAAMHTSSVFAADVVEHHDVTYTLGEDDFYETVELNQSGVDEWTSSDENVVCIESWRTGQNYAVLRLVGPGSSEVIAYNGGGVPIGQITVTVRTPEIIISKSDLSFCTTDSDPHFDINQGYDLRFRSTNEKVVKVRQDLSDNNCCHLELISANKGIEGKEASVIVTDCAGISKTVRITVSNARWKLSKTSIRGDVSDGGFDLEISPERISDDGFYNNHFTGSSSNNRVVSVDYEGYSYGNMRLVYHSPGTAVITVADKFGKTATCSVTLTADPLKLNCSSLTFDTIAGENENRVYTDENWSNDIESASSSNRKVATVTVTNEGYYHVANVNPVGAGSAVITVTDQYGQSANVSVKVTQKYIDESRYMNALRNSSFSGTGGNLTYGDTTLYCNSSIASTIYTTINGKKYTAAAKGNGTYLIRGIPKLSAGSRIAVTFQKGNALYTAGETVQPKQGGSLKVKVKDKTYTGSSLKPAVTIRDGSTALRSGTDYTLRYSNNKKVGTAKVKITFRGNYTGTATASFRILPRSTSISKLTPQKKGFLIKWKKQATQTTGYHIQYGTKKNFSSGSKIIKVKKNRTVSKEITKLKGKKKYYVRIRTYKVVSGEEYCSSWSKAGTVTTRK